MLRAKICAVLGATILIMSLAACGAGNIQVSSNGNATLKAIAITPPDTAIALDTDQQLTATGIYSDNSTKDLTDSVTWSSSDTNVVTIDNLRSMSGHCGHIWGRHTGRTTVKATWGQTSGSTTISGTTSVTVTPATLVSLAITPTNQSIALGTTQQFVATGTFSDGSTQNLTTAAAWSSSSTGVAAISNAAGSQGLATPAATGSTTITATSGTISGTTTLTVTAASLVSIAVTPTNRSIALGTTQQFTATGTFSDGSTQNLTTAVVWSSGAAGVATISNTAGSQGLATPAAIGSSMITATSGAVSGSTTLTVTAATLVSIAVTPTNPSIALGTTQQFTATATFSDGSTQNLTTTATWSSGTASTASISNAAGSKGLATPAAIGTTTVTATSGVVSDSTTLTVTAATLASIAVTPTNPSIALGTTQQFTATGTFSNGSTQNLTTSVTWSAGSTGVATISNAAGSKGLATPSAIGTTTVTATSGAVSGSTTLTVTAATLVSIAITPANPGIVQGATQQFSATGTYSDGSSQNLTASVTWSSGSTGVATISNAAGSQGLATSVTGGTTIISCTLGLRTGTTTLSVSSPAPPSGAPQILYTDIVAGPVAGGENNKGAYLSLFGKNFGSTGLGSTVKVYINNVEVDNYRYLGASKGRSDIQQITVQVGALGNPASGVALPIKVVVNGVSSNTDQTFTVQPSGFLFVDPVSGNDSTAVKNDITHPWKNVQTSSGYDSGAIGKTVPGDTIVLRGGNYTGDGWDGYWLKFYNFAGNAPTGAAGHGYITVTSYPAETVTIHPTNTSNFGVISGGGSGFNAKYIVIANLTVIGSVAGNTTFHDGTVNLQVLSDYWRVMNNDLSSPNAPSTARAGAVTGDGRFDVIVGNNIHDMGGGSQQEYHGMYFDAGNDYEIAYNNIINVPGGCGISLYNSSGTTPNIYNVNIHHNLIHDISKHGVNIADTTTSGIVVYNNVIYNTGENVGGIFSSAEGCGIRFNTNSLVDAKIYNNTIYNSNANGINGDLYGAICSDWNIPAGGLEVMNNIFYTHANTSYTAGAVSFSSTMGPWSNNIYYGTSTDTPPSWDTGKQTIDPKFVSNGVDFHLQATSPAIDHGTSTVSGVVANDFDVTTSRPQGSAYDIGAFEYAP